MKLFRLALRQRTDFWREKQHLVLVSLIGLLPDRLLNLRCTTRPLNCKIGGGGAESTDTQFKLSHFRDDN